MKRNLCSKYLIIAVATLLFFSIFSSVATSEILKSDIQSDKILITINESKSGSAPIEVWVDDDYYDGGYNGGHTWGYDAFDNIQDGVDNVSDDGTVHVYEGTYDVFKIEGRFDIILEAVDDEVPLVAGSQQAWDSTASSMVNCVVFVNNSDNVYLKGLNIQGIGLSGRSFAVYYTESTGTINDCTVSPNQKGNMNNLGIRAHLNSTLSVENCTVLNYGRIGIYIRTGTTLNAVSNKLIGQIYTDADGDYVSYGIEVEDLQYASHATIRYNEIYNHDHTGNPTWSSAGIIVDTWRYYQVTSENCSAIIEYNNIHDNMLGVQIVPNENIHMNRNKIHHHSSHGAVSDPYWDGTTYVYYNLDAENNWWGDPTGPFHPTENPDGLGDEITDYVLFEPWIEHSDPIVNITTPENGFLYVNFRDIIVFKLPFFTNLIIGKIEVEADAPDCLFGMDRVEFYVDDVLQTTDYTEPYSWTWDELELLFFYTIKVVAYDNAGNSAVDDIGVWKFL